MSTSQIPFRMGDVVTYTGSSSSWKGEHVIHDVKFSCVRPLRFEYSTTQGAWIKHADLALVQPASEEALQKLTKVLMEEGLLEGPVEEEDDDATVEDDELEEDPDDADWN